MGSPDGSSGVYEIRLGDTLRKSDPDRVYHTFKFGRIPAGTDQEKPSKVEVNDQNISILVPNAPLKNAPRPALRFEGKWDRLHQKDSACVLIFDPESKTFVLERVSNNADLKCVRKTVGPSRPDTRTPTPPPQNKGPARQAQLVEGTAAFTRKPPITASRPVASRNGRKISQSHTRAPSPSRTPTKQPAKPKPKRRLSKKKETKEIAKRKSPDTTSVTSKEDVAVDTARTARSEQATEVEGIASDQSSSSGSSSDSSGSDSSSDTSSDDDDEATRTTITRNDHTSNKSFDIEDDLMADLGAGLGSPSHDKSAARATPQDGDGGHNSDSDDDFMDA